MHAREVRGAAHEGAERHPRYALCWCGRSVCTGDDRQTGDPTHGPVHLLQLRGRSSDLVGGKPRGGEGGECVALTARDQGLHEHADGPLSQRFCNHQRLELRHGLRSPTRCQQRLRVLLSGCPAVSGSPPLRTGTGWTRTGRRRRHGVRGPPRRGGRPPSPAARLRPAGRGAGAVARAAVLRARPPALAPEVARLDRALRAAAAQQHAEALLATGRAAEAVAEPRGAGGGGAAAARGPSACSCGPWSPRDGRATHSRSSPASARGSPTSSASTRRRSCGSSSGGSCVRSCPSPASPVAPARNRPPAPAPRARGCRSAPSWAAPRTSRASSTPCGAAGWSLCAVRVGWARRGWPGTSPRRSPTATTTACWSSSSARAEPADVEPLRRRGAAAHATAGPSGAVRMADGIVEVLSVRNQLVVLDNCEHVCDEVATLVEAIIAAAPGVDLLLTSREPVRVDGEQVLPVAPLEPGAAARLLVDRMQAGDPAAAPDPEDELVAEVCRRLDHLPLALELAAARALPLGLPGLLDALETSEEPLGVLRGGRRTASPRHRSLRDVVAWSYGLLDEERRTLFDRLSVFAGPVEYGAVRRGLRRRRCTARPRRPLARRPAPGGARAVRDARDAARLRPVPLRRRPGREPAAGPARGVGGTAGRRGDRGRRGSGEPAAIRRFDAHLADLRRAHAWLCSHGPLDELLRLTVPIAELSLPAGACRPRPAARGDPPHRGALDPDQQVHGRAHPLLARLLGYHAHTWWQRGNLDARGAPGPAGTGDRRRVGRPDVGPGRAGGAGERPRLPRRPRRRASRGERAYELAVAADDADVLAMVLMDLATQSAYAGRPRRGRAVRGHVRRARRADRVRDRTGAASLTSAASAGPSAATRTRRGTWRRPSPWPRRPSCRSRPGSPGTRW